MHHAKKRLAAGLVCGIALGLGAGWTVSNAFRNSSSRTQGTAAADHPDATSLSLLLPSDPIAGEHLLETTTYEGLSAALQRAEATFWEGDPSANRFMFIYGKRSEAKLGVKGLNQAISSIPAGVSPSTRSILLRSLVDGFFSNTIPDSHALADTLGGISNDDVSLVLQVFLGRIEYQTLSQLKEVASPFSKSIPAWQEKGNKTLDLIVIGAWIAKGAPEIEELLKANPKLIAQFREPLLQHIGELAALKPTRAKELVAVLLRQSKRDGLQVFIASGLSFAAFQEASNSLPPGQSDGAWTDLRNALQSQSPLALRKLFLEVAPSAIPRSSFNGFIQDGLRYSPSETIKWLSQIGTKEAALKLDQVVLGGFTYNPTTAHTFVLERLALGAVPEDFPPHILAAAIAFDRSQADPLLARVPEKVAIEAKNLLTIQAAQDATADGPGAFGELLARSSPSERKVMLLGLGQMVGSSPGLDAPALARSLPDEEKSLFIDSILRSPTARAVPGAVQVALVEELLKGTFDTKYTSSVTRVVQAFCQGDPNKGLSLINQIPVESERERAMVPFITNLTRADPARTCDWVTRMPNGRQRDLAVYAVVKAAPDELDTTLLSIRAIEDEKIRQQALSYLQTQWSKADPDRFRDAMQKAGLKGANSND